MNRINCSNFLSSNTTTPHEVAGIFAGFYFSVHCEYHIKQSIQKQDLLYKVAHFALGLFEGIPLLGAIIVLIERFVKNILFSISQPENTNHINYTDRSKTTDIFSAIARGEEDTIRNFLVQGVDPNKQDDSGDSLLMIAVMNGNLPIVELLLQHEANPNLTDITGRTVLHMAVILDRLEIFNAILQNEKTDIYIKDNIGRPAIFYSSLKENTHYYIWLKNKYILKESYINDLCICDIFYNTIIFYADNPYILEDVIKTVKNDNYINRIEDSSGNTALMHHIREENTGNIKVLLKHDADPNIPNNNNQNAEDYFKSYGNNNADWAECAQSLEDNKRRRKNNNKDYKQDNRKISEVKMFA